MSQPEPSLCNIPSLSDDLTLMSPESEYSWYTKDRQVAQVNLEETFQLRPVTSRARVVEVPAQSGRIYQGSARLRVQERVTTESDKAPSVDRLRRQHAHAHIHIGRPGTSNARLWRQSASIYQVRVDEASWSNQ